MTKYPLCPVCGVRLVECSYRLGYLICDSLGAHGYREVLPSEIKKAFIAAGKTDLPIYIHGPLMEGEKLTFLDGPKAREVILKDWYDFDIKNANHRIEHLSKLLSEAKLEIKKLKKEINAK